MKQLYAVAGLALLASTPALAQDAKSDALTVYGRANVSFQSVDEDNGSDTDVKSHSSRFGFKGKADLDNDLEVFYQFEFGVDLADFDGDAVSNRNQIVGLRGSFGKVMLGRYDTFLKDSQGGIDQFKDWNADLKYLFPGETRADNSLTYYSPSFNNFSFGVTYVSAEDDSEEDGYSLGVIYGDEKLKKTRFYAAFAIDRDISGYDIEQFSVATKVADVKLGAALQQFTTTDRLFDADGYLLSAAYPIDNWVVKGQYQSLDDGEETDSSVSLGAEYHFSGDTRVFTFYTNRNCDIQFYETRGCGASPGVEQTYLAVGIRHDFSW